MPKAITLKEAQTAYSLAIEVGQVSQGPIIVEYEGKPVAVIMSIEDYRQHFSFEYDAWRQEQLQRLEPNRTAFQQLLPELLKTHRDQFVALYQEKLVDADPDRVALVQRTRAQGYRPVYIQKVTSEPRIVELPSPEEVWRVPL
jgi:PHD/YefM family antitoxin component YafN of YafNO toxin-antitoxin module